MSWFWNGTGENDSITLVLKLCDTCKKRYYIEGNYECDYCWNYYHDMKLYRCHSPKFISRRWLRICYKLHIPHNWIRFFFRGGRK